MQWRNMIPPTTRSTVLYLDASSALSNYASDAKNTVQRVRRTALALANAMSPKPDLLVVELGPCPAKFPLPLASLIERPRCSCPLARRSRQKIRVRRTGRRSLRLFPPIFHVDGGETRARSRSGWSGAPDRAGCRQRLVDHGEQATEK